MEAFLRWLKGLFQPASPALYDPPVSIVVPRERSAVPVVSVMPLAWGARVSARFRDKVRMIADAEDMDPNHISAIIAFESARTFSPAITNPYSNAVGLIQFLPSTAKYLGTSTDELKRMTAVEQLEFVQKYFHLYSDNGLYTLLDAYASVLYPKAIGKPPEYVLFKDDPEGHRRYFNNRGLDVNLDHQITKQEAGAKVGEMLMEGLKPENLA